MVRQAQGAAAFLQKIESLEGQVRSLLEGPILQNLPVAFSLFSFTSLLAAVEELESQPSLLPPRVQELTVEARARVQQFASSLIEPDVRIEGAN